MLKARLRHDTTAPRIEWGRLFSPRGEGTLLRIIPSNGRRRDCRCIRRNWHACASEGAAIARELGSSGTRFRAKRSGSPAGKPRASANMKITVQANSGEFSFECEATERLLYAGLTQGLRLPYECATGTCGTCRGRVVQGSTLVEWDEAPGFARLEARQGRRADVPGAPDHGLRRARAGQPRRRPRQPDAAPPPARPHRAGAQARRATSSRSTSPCRGPSRSTRASSSCWRCRVSRAGAPIRW